MVKLGDVVSFIGGSQPPKSTFLYEPKKGFVRLLQIRDYKSDKNLTFIPETSTKKFCTKDDVMIGRYGPPVFQILQGLEGAYNVALMKAKPSEKVDRDYLYYFLKQDELFRLIDGLSQRTAGQSGIDMDALKGYPMLLPPLAEQKRIAAILDKADAIRRKRKQAIQLADDFLRSVFLDMFGDPVTNPKGWVRCKFSDLINLITYGLTVRPEYIKEGISLISAREIRTGDVLLDTAPKISQKDFDKLSDKAKPKINDILFSKTGSIGHCAIVTSDKIFAVTQNAARIVPNAEKVNPIFLLSLLRTKYFYDLSNREAKGNAVKDLQLGVMKEFVVYCPPLDLQEEYVQLRTAIIELSEKQQISADESVNAFNSLSQKAFAGEL